MTAKQEPRTRANNQPADGAMDQRLLLYALAAGTTLACSVPSRAAVFFTHSDAVLHGNGTLAIDLDHDGTVDFTVSVGQCISFSGYGKQACIAAYGASNSKRIAISGRFPRATAFPRGATVGSSNVFRVRALMGTGFNSDYYGRWTRTANQFLGVKFVLNGRTHFGWIGFRSVYGVQEMSAKLAGWAYETVPGKPIVTDERGSGTAPAASVHPTSLEVLAGGHTAIVERRKRTVTLTK